MPLVAIAAAALAQDARCLALARLRLPAVRIEEARTVSGPLPDAPGVDAPVAVCRVRGTARPSRRSHIGFELWLPRDGWNGRYYQLGNGGFAGNIHLPSLAWETGRGNAAAATDTGHKGTGFDARWAKGNPDAVEDYGHRSIKATSDAAARLIRAYYGRTARWRYFAGCSNGGRQALMAAARYPSDWDGILAGSPAARWTSQLRRLGTLQRTLRATPGRWLPARALPGIQARALMSCPPGSVADGVALDPTRCRLDPGLLACGSLSQSPCLTNAQLVSLRAILAAGYQPTAAAYEDGWARWILNPDPKQPSQLTFAREAATYLFSGATASRTAAGAAHRRLSAVIDVDPRALARFKAKGGVILSYFGWADPLLPPLDAVAFYRAVARRSGPTESFYRLFMVPGMGHCQGGLGPTAFGQSLAAPARSRNADDDARSALEQWVERGRAPETIRAFDPASGETRTLDFER